MKQSIFKLIHEDSSLLVIEKCQPFLSQATDNQNQEALYQFVGRNLGQELYPVHRLDRDVLGIMVFGKTAKAAEWLSLQFKERKTKKVYWARVWGQPYPKENELIHFLQKNSQTNYVTVFPRETPGAKEAKLRYKVLSETNSLRQSLVEVELFTGRTHQIRAQLSKIGHPIVGDSKYYNKKAQKTYGDLRLGKNGICLRSVCLGVFHPENQEWMEWSLLNKEKKIDSDNKKFFEHL